MFDPISYKLASDIERKVSFPITNLVANASFGSETGWQSNNGSVVFTGSEAVVTIDNLSGQTGIYRYGQAVKVEHLYYMSAEYLVTHNNDIRLAYGGRTAFARLKTGEWGRVGAIISPLSTSSLIAFYHDTTKDYSVGDTFKVRKPLLVDLTETFGAGNEPTKAEFEELLTFFDEEWFEETTDLANHKWFMIYLMNKIKAKADSPKEEGANYERYTPIVPQTETQALVVLDGGVRNYANHSVEVRGDLSYTTCDYYNGGLFDNNQLVVVPVDVDGGDMNSGTLFVKFRTIEAFAPGQNKEYTLLELRDDHDNTISLIRLNYLDSTTTQGGDIWLRNGTNLRHLVLPNLSFDADQVHSLAVVWNYVEEQGLGNLAVYVDGLIERATTFEAKYIPQNAGKLCIGNRLSLGSHANVVIESAVYATNALDTSGIAKLHSAPIDPSALIDRSIYRKVYYPIGYHREVGDVIVFNYHNDVLWGVYENARGTVVKSIDGGNSWVVHKDFAAENPDNRVEAIEFADDSIFVAVRNSDTSTLQKAPLPQADEFSTVITFTPGRYLVNGWNFDTYDGNIVVSEYGQSDVTARMFLSTDGGNTFHVIRQLPQGSNHFHNTKFDPYTGYLWVTWGDGIDATEYSTDLGESWSVVTDHPENQCISIVFTKDAVFFGSDSIAGGSHLRVYDKKTGIYRRLSAPTFRYLNHVYALHVDHRGYLWWFGNKENMSGKVSTIYTSPDLGATPVLVEELETENIANPYRFVEVGGKLYLGNSCIVKPVLVRQ